MDRRAIGTSSSRIPRSGAKRAPPHTSTAAPSKMARLTGRKQRHQLLGPRRAAQIDNTRSTVPHASIVTTSIDNTQSEAISGRPSTLNRPSFIATAIDRPQPSRISVDKRPFRDPEFQRAAIRSIVQYLTSHGYGPINAASLRNMENRTFQQVFKFLHLHVMPSYIYPERFQDVFIEIVKAFKYPRTETLSARALFSVAAPHSYPAFLAVLSWMVDMCKDFDAIANHYANQGEDVDEEDRSEDANILFFDYSVATYSAFLNGANTFDEYYQKLLGLLDDLKAKYIENAKKVSEVNSRLQEQLNELKSKPDLKQKYLEERARMEKDMTKFEEYNNEMRKRIAKYTESIAKTERELKYLEAQCATVKQEHMEMQQVLKSHNTSLEEIGRLNDEQTALEKECANSQSLAQKLAKEQSTLENELSKQIAKTEELGKEYNAQLSELGITKTEEGKNLYFELNANAETLEQLCSVDLNRVALPYLEKLKQQYETSFNQETERLTETHKELSTLTEQLAEQQARVVLSKENLDQATKAHETERKRFLQEVQKINEDLAQKEQDMKKMKRDAKERLYTYEKREQELKLTVADYKAKATARQQQLIQEGSERLAKIQAMRKKVEQLGQQMEEQMKLI